jgi:phosphatidyl-myo-inositol dimannoside synthase
MSLAKKVLWISERFPPDRGGAATSAARQVQGIAPHLDRLDVVRLSSSLPPARVECRPCPGFSVYEVGRAPEADESLQLLSEAAGNLHRTHGYDLLHGFYAVHAGYVAVVTGRLTGRPVLVSLRGNDLDRALFHGPRLPILHWTLQNADALACVSREMLRKVELLTGRGAGLHHLPNAVDTELFRPGLPTPAALAPHLDAPRPWIAFSGELRLKKGLPLLEELAEHLAARGTGTLFWIGGVRREERAAAEDWLRRAHGATRVRVLSWQDEPATLAAVCGAMDLFVFPSLWEGMPNALLEAMACARPAVAAAVGAIPELIEDGVTGILVPPERLSQFASIVVDALGDPGRLARMGEAARERACHEFAPQRERDALLQLYAALAR